MALAAGAVGYGLVAWHERSEHAPPDTYGAHPRNERHHELDWIREDLRVTAPQMQRIEELHEAYHPVCEQLARELALSHQNLAALSTRNTEVTPELEAALRHHAEVHLKCHRAMLRHFYETAACLSPEQARRFLDRMLPTALRLASESGNQDHS